MKTVNKDFLKLIADIYDMEYVDFSLNGLNKMKLNDCISCNSPVTTISYNPKSDKFMIFCDCCDNVGQKAKTLKKAKQNWNKENPKK